MILGRAFCSLKNVWLRKIELSDKGRELLDVMGHSCLLYGTDQGTIFKLCTAQVPKRAPCYQYSQARRTDTYPKGIPFIASQSYSLDP